MLRVFSDSVDRLEWVSGGQNWHRSRDVNFDTLKSIISCFPSRHGPERSILNVSIPCGPKRSRVSHSLYTLNKATPESMCVSTTMILTRKLKISESVIRKWEIGICPLVTHLVTFGLLKVSPDLCNYKKLTSETSKSNPNRYNMILVIKWEFIVIIGSLDGLEMWFWLIWVHSNPWIDVMCV